MFAVAGLAAVAAGLFADVGGAIDRDLHGRYAGLLADESRTQGVLLVAVDEPTIAAWDGQAEAGEAALESALRAASPRLVIWPEGHVKAGSALAGSSRAHDEVMGLDPLMGPPLTRASEAGFPGPALAALGLPVRPGPLPVHYVSSLPTLSAYRVATGEIPAASLRDRVVVVGRTDREAASVATPLGAMSPAQVEAHALLGALDGVAWRSPPRWLGQAAAGLWACALALALRGRSAAGMLAVAVAACAVAALVDFGLFAAGLARIGVGAALLVAGVAALAQWVVTTVTVRAPTWSRRPLAARVDDALAAANTASGVHTWSDA